jgi:hypothetical protein
MKRDGGDRLDFARGIETGLAADVDLSTLNGDRCSPSRETELF